MNEALEIPFATEAEEAFRDSLTGLHDRNLFLFMLGREVKRARRYGTPFTLAMIDIDSFFQRSDRLNDIAGMVATSIRELDLAVRYSEDAFAVILAGADARSAHIAAERILRAVGEQIEGEPNLCIGLASCPRDATTGPRLIRLAREASLRAKISGKDTCLFHDKQETPGDDSLPNVLVVDDESLNLELMEAILSQLPVNVIKTSSGEEALSLVDRVHVDLVLLDVVMPGMDGYQVCRRLKGGERTRLIPVIMLTGLDELEAKIKGIEAGADDFIVKPPNHAELLARTQSLIKVKGLNDNLISIESVLFSLAGAVEAKDAYTQGHIVRTAQMAVVLGRRLGVTEKEIRALRFGGMLHDIGKIGVPREILNKNRPLNDEEWKIIRSHSDVGYRVCSPLKTTLGPALDIIRYHHERLDGSGYPDGLRGEEIPLVARIMAVVDMYDALVTDRPYRGAMRQKEALAVIRQSTREGKLDPGIVARLVEMVTG